MKKIVNELLKIARQIYSGWWPSKHGVNGDIPADIMDKAIDDVRKAYREAFNRPPTYGEFADVLSFCTRGQFVIRPKIYPDHWYDDEHEDKFKTRPNQGQIDFSKTPGKGLVNIIPPGKKDISDEIAEGLRRKEEVKGEGGHLLSEEQLLKEDK